MRFSNLRSYQQVLRIAVGAVLLAAGWWWGEDWASSWTVPLRVLALYPLITGVLGWCPVKSLLTNEGHIHR